MKLSRAVREFEAALYGEVSEKSRTWYVSMVQTLIVPVPPHWDGLGHKAIADITASDLRAWRVYVFNRPTRFGTPPKPSSKKAYLKAIKRFFDWAVADPDNGLTHSPAAGLKFKEVHSDHEDVDDIKAISQADCIAILSAIYGSGSWRDLLLIKCLISWGCRVSGLVRVRLEDIDWANNRVRLREKGKKSRYANLEEEVLEALLNWLQVRPNKGDYLFPGRGFNSHLTRQGVAHILSGYATKAGVTGAHNPHSFRHAFAIHLMKEGVNLGVISKMMGHSTVAVTADIYGRFATEQLQEIHNQHSPLKQLNLINEIQRNAERRAPKST